jgi:hypothetical protein
MAVISPDIVVQVAHPVALMGMTTSPASSIFETMREAKARLGSTYENLRYDSAVRLLYLEPVYDPQDMSLDDWERGPGTWREIKDRVSGKNVIAMTSAEPDVEWNARLRYEDINKDILLNGSGLYVTINRAAPHPDAARDSDETYVSIGFGPTAEKTLARIHWPFGVAPMVQMIGEVGDSEVDDWLTVGQIPIGEAKINGEPASITFQIMLIGGNVVFRAGQAGEFNDPALVLRAPQVKLKWPLWIEGQGFNASFSAFHMKFKDSGGYVSALKDKQWPTPTVPIVRIEGNDDGLFYFSKDAGTKYHFQYGIDFTKTERDHLEEYIETTPYVESVNVYFPSIQVPPKAGISWATLPGVQNYREEKWFDMNELTVNSRCTITFRNRNPFPANMPLAQYSPYGAASGMRALRVLAGWVGQDLPLRYAGYCGHVVEGDQHTFTLHGVDLSYSLRRMQMYNPPFGDGMCIYHYIKTLAQRGGITQGRLAINKGNPPDAWTCDGYSCDERKGHLKLRRGTGLNPLVRFPDGTPVWTAMQEIRRLYGFALYFDKFGYLRFFPWQPWNARNEWSPAQWFSAVPQMKLTIPGDPFSARPALNEFLDNVLVRRSLEDTRNSLTLVGLDRDRYEPFSVHYRDDAAIFGDGTYGTMPPNFKGFVDSVVDSSAMYIDQAWTDRVARAQFQIFRQPRETHEITGFGQDLEPLAYVAIDAHRMMTDRPFDKFFVASTQMEIDVLRQSYKAKFNCELIPYALTMAGNPFEEAHAGNGDVDEDDVPVGVTVVDQSTVGDHSTVE